MHRTRGAPALAASLLLAAAPAGAAPFYSAPMNDAQEIAPGGTSNTTGTAIASLELLDNFDPIYGGGTISLQMEIVFDPIFNFRNFAGAGAIDNGGTQIVSNLHIHNAARGVNGVVVWGIFEPDHDTDEDSALFNLPGGFTRITSEWDLTEGNGTVTLANFLDALRTAGPGQDVPLYLNLHSGVDPAGVIRGQIVGAPEPATLLLLALGLAVLARQRGA
jgi:hypothetical protein